LKKSIKTTKIAELETELQTHVEECHRLRKIAEETIVLKSTPDTAELANYEE
jgi:predicted small metal-binding protein